MIVQLELSWLLALTLVSLRLTALLWATPLFALGHVPARFKLVLILVFGAALASLHSAEIASGIDTFGDFFAAAAVELTVGALMAFGLHCAFGAFLFGGRLLDLQMGFGVANLINPSSNEQDPLIGVLLLSVGVMTFYLLDGHHWIVRSVVQSYQWFPLGHLPSTIPINAIVAQFGSMFVLGVMLVAPVVAVLLLVDSAMAIASRTMPQMNIFMLSIPIKIVVGLLILAGTAPYIRSMLERVYGAVFTYWQALVR